MKTLLKTNKLYILSGMNIEKMNEYTKDIPEELIIRLSDIRDMLSIKNTVYKSTTEYDLKHSIDSTNAEYLILRGILEERSSQGLTTFYISENETIKIRNKVFKMNNPLDTEILFFEDNNILDKKESEFDFRIVKKNHIFKLIPRYILSEDKIDFIGDIHGLYDSFIKLTEKLGYEKIGNNLIHKDNRKICFLGDFIDRGPDSVELMFFVRSLVKNGHFAILGNHEEKLIRIYDKYVRGEEIQSKGAALKTLSDLMENHKKGKVTSIIDFLRTLPHYYTIEIEGIKIACTHASMVSFSPETISRSNALYGQYRRVENDSDKEYSDMFKLGVNKYYLIHGHIKKSSNQDYSISLEEGSAFGGDISALRVEDIVTGMKKEDTYKYIDNAIVRVDSGFSYKEDGDKNILKKEMQSLLERGLASASLSPCKFMNVFKYKKNVFFENLWNESEYLVKTRGLILDKSGKIIVHPFDKVFNYLENGTAKNFDKRERIQAVEKMNGFLGNITKNPFTGDLMFTTTGGFDTMFTDYIQEFITPEIKKELFIYFKSNKETLSFEVIHEKDPHIIEYTKEDMGLYLIGARGTKETDKSKSEEDLDKIALLLKVKRPKHFYIFFEDLLKKVETEEIEGYLVRSQYNDNKVICKLKTTFYLHSKILGRLKYKHVDFMFENPIKFKEIIGDEDIFELMEEVIKEYSSEEFKNIPVKNRISKVRSIIKRLRK